VRFIHECDLYTDVYGTCIYISELTVNAKYRTFVTEASKQEQDILRSANTLNGKTMN